MKNKNLNNLIAILIIISSLPALIGFLKSDTSQVYSGVVFNPIDGYSYMAKMQIGQSGDWLFTLPFTPQPGEGRWLFTFYISLGQLLRLIGVPLPVGFNMFRLVGYGLLVVLLAKLTDVVFPSDNRMKVNTTVLLAAGGGLGWLLLPMGNFGADFWVAEAFPFLSGLANPHFPLGLSMTVAAILISTEKRRAIILPGLSLMGVALSILSPFGFVITAIVLTGSWLWEKLDRQSVSIWPVICFMTFGIPYCAYQFWAVNSTPQLAAWTVQNQTPSPQIWDTFLAFCPWLILILVGWKTIYKARESRTVRRLIVWLMVGLALSIIPFSLQRRFFFGLSIPVACLGMLCLPEVAEKFRVSVKKLTTICTVLVLPTPILLSVMVISAVATHSPLYYFQSDELKAIHWLSQQNGGRSLVLAGDQTGTLIPAVSRLRVIYGHPFETLQSDAEKQSLIDFYSGISGLAGEKEYLESRRVNWVLYGEREKAIGQPVIFQKNDPAAKFGDVDIYSVAEILP